MLAKFRVKNFKSIRDSGKVELKPLTILTGPNASGKSNFLEAIAFISQVARMGAEVRKTVVSVTRGGYFVNYPDIAFITYGKNQEMPFEMEMSFPLGRRERKQIETSAGTISYSFHYKPDTRELEQTIFLGSETLVKTAYTSTTRGTTRNMFLHPPILAKYGPREIADQLLSIQTFSPLEPMIPDRERLKIGETLRKARNCTEVILKKLKRTYLISASRGSVPNVGKTEEFPEWVLKDGTGLLSLLSLIFSKREYSAKAAKINFWAERFGIASMGGGWWGGNEIGVDFEDPILKQTLELSLASFGTRQVLSIITQIFWSEKADIIMIEEPEISLHPDSQIVLQELFAEAIRQQKQIICTTHSPFFVLGLSRVIKKRKLASKDVVVYHVKKTPKKGTRISKLSIDQQGFIKGWIPSFAEAESKLLDEMGDLFRE